METMNNYSATNTLTSETNTPERFTLIEGEFSIAESKDILTNVFQKKINFHESKNFSSQVRFGKNDETAMKRIPELKMALANVLELLDKAESQHKKLCISSEIHINIVE